MQKFFQWIHFIQIFLLIFASIKIFFLIQIKRRVVARLSSASILPPMQMEMAERWHMNWEYVVYRISHGLHFAIMKNITDVTPRQKVIYINVQKCYPRRFIRSNIAPVQVCTTFKLFKKLN